MCMNTDLSLIKTLQVSWATGFDSVGFSFLGDGVITARSVLQDFSGLNHDQKLTNA